MCMEECRHIHTSILCEQIGFVVHLSMYLASNLINGVYYCEEMCINSQKISNPMIFLSFNGHVES